MALVQLPDSPLSLSDLNLCDFVILSVRWPRAKRPQDRDAGRVITSYASLAGPWSAIGAARREGGSDASDCQPLAAAQPGQPGPAARVQLWKHHAACIGMRFDDSGTRTLDSAQQYMASSHMPLADPGVFCLYPVGSTSLPVCPSAHHLLIVSIHPLPYRARALFSAQY